MGLLVIVQVVNKPQEPPNSSWRQQKVLMGNAVQIEDPGKTSADSWPVVSETVSLDDIIKPQCEAALQTSAGETLHNAMKWLSESLRAMKPEIQTD